MSSLVRAVVSLVLIVSAAFFSPGISVAKKISNLCRISYPSDKQVEWKCRRLKGRETLESLFGGRWIDAARFNRMDRRHAYAGISIKVPDHPDDIKGFSPMPMHYEPAETEDKFILIDLAEEFLGAYERGNLVLSSPIAAGEKEHETPQGDFRITAYDSRHKSSVYTIEKTRKLYPMHFGLRFHISKDWVSFWIHGRDVPGYPASHGCIGLYDEAMQKSYYGYPKEPVLDDARRLFEWVISPAADDGKFHILKSGPKVRIINYAPVTK